MNSFRDRREFLTTASSGLLSAGLIGATAFQNSVLAAGSAERIVKVALIGCGGRGTHDIQLFRNNPGVEVTWVCDPDNERRGRVAKSLGVPDNRSTPDLRQLLNDDALDAVVVATPDHWHSIASIMACNAGKHVYVEKPISHNIREGRLLAAAAARNKVHVQHGTQSRSTQMMIDAVRLLREGIIGNVMVAKCWNIQRRGSIGRGMETDPPAGFDYDTWVGPALMVPYRTNRVHNRWSWWYHFGTGDMGNDGVHDIDYTRWGLGVETHPSTVSAVGGKYMYDDDQEFPDTQQVTFEYPGNGKVGSRRMLIYEQRLWSTNYPHNVDSGAEFYGTSGQMFLSRRGKIQVIDEKNRPVDVPVKTESQNDVAHVQNFLAAIRENSPLNADALTGHLSTSLCHLGNIATRVGRALKFNHETERVIGDDEADALTQREYRDHWGKPDVS